MYYIKQNTDSAYKDFPHRIEAYKNNKRAVLNVEHANDKKYPSHKITVAGDSDAWWWDHRNFRIEPYQPTKKESNIILENIFTYLQ